MWEKITSSPVVVVSAVLFHVQASSFWYVTLWSTELKRRLLQVIHILPFDKDTCLLEMVEEVVPEVVSCEDNGVADDDQAEAGSGEGYVHASWVSQEPDSLPFVASYR